MRIDRIKLNAEMRQQKMTEKKLAEKSHVSRNTISAIRNGKSCSENTVNHIALALGVEPWDLLEEG